MPESSQNNTSPEAPGIPSHGVSAPAQLPFLAKTTGVVVTGVALLVFFGWYYWFFDSRLRSWSILTVAGFTAYLLILPALLANRKRRPFERARWFFHTGYVGIFLTVVSWSLVRADYAGASSSDKIVGDSLSQMISVLGGVVGASLVVHGIRMWSDEINKG
jgi:hypothetical protein